MINNDLIDLNNINLDLDFKDIVIDYIQEITDFNFNDISIDFKFLDNMIIDFSFLDKQIMFYAQSFFYASDTGYL